jgi:hypothetical protein
MLVNGSRAMEEQLSHHPKVVSSIPATAAGTIGQFNKHFKLVNHSSSKEGWTIFCMHAFVHCFQNALDYFAPVVS